MEVVPVNDTKPKIMRSDGITYIKGGQYVNEGFMTAVMKSYSNLTNQPAALIFLIFMIFVFLSEYNTTTGPLEELNTRLDKIAKGGTNAFERSFANALVIVLKILVKYKAMFIKLGFVWFVYMVKPSSNNLYVCLVETFVIFLLRDWSVLSFVLLSQAHFIYTSVRTPSHKLFTFILAIVLIFLGVDIGGLSINTK